MIIFSFPLRYSWLLLWHVILSWNLEIWVIRLWILFKPSVLTGLFWLLSRERGKVPPLTCSVSVGPGYLLASVDTLLSKDGDSSGYKWKGSNSCCTLDFHDNSLAGRGQSSSWFLAWFPLTPLGRQWPHYHWVVVKVLILLVILCVLQHHFQWERGKVPLYSGGDGNSLVSRPLLV